MNQLTYIVVILIPREISVLVRGLGKVALKKGYYIYIGSGGKSPYRRISRHFRIAKKRRWHIDYITNIYPAVEAYIIVGADEYMISEYLYKLGFSFIPKFGSTDKKSKSHFFYTGQKCELEEAIKSLIKDFRVVTVNYDDIPV